MNKLLLSFLVLFLGTSQVIFSQCMGSPVYESCTDPPIECELSAINGFQGCLPEYDGVLLGDFCGQGVINNPAYFSFVAGTSDLALTIEVSDCVANEGFIGLQANIIDPCDPSTCYGNSGFICATTTFSFSAAGLTIGNIYQLVIDGCNGSECAFTVLVDSAPPFEIPEPGPKMAYIPDPSDCPLPADNIVVCPGSTVIFSPGDSFIQPHFFCWEIDNPSTVVVNNNSTDCSISNPGSSFNCSSTYSTCGSISLSFMSAGTYELCLIEMDNGCDNITPTNYCYNIKVEQLVSNFGSYDICESALPFFNPPPHPDTGQPWYGDSGSNLQPGINTHSVGDSCGCSYEQEITINILPVESSQNYDIDICAYELQNWVDPFNGITYNDLLPYQDPNSPNDFIGVFIQGGSGQSDWEGLSCDLTANYHFNIYDIPGQIGISIGFACDAVLCFAIDQTLFPDSMNEGDIGYQWSDENSIIGLTECVAITNEGMYSLQTHYVKEDGNTCTFNQGSIQVDGINFTPATPTFISSPSFTCLDSIDSLVFAVNESTGTNYNWTVTNGTITAGFNTHQITTSVFDPSFPMTVSVFSETPGCGQSPEATHTFSVLAPPVIQLVHDATVDVGDTIKVEADITSGSAISYLWNVPSTNATYPSANSQLASLPISWDAAGVYSVSLSIMDAAGCSSEEVETTINVIEEGIAPDVSMFIFGHSLINHALPINEVPSQETSIPHWMHFLSEAAGNTYAVAGQYGFLPQHANIPPISQWGFDYANPAWESDYETFAEADFSHILLTPANFAQWQSPEINYPYEDVSPVSASNTIINWCAEQEDDLNFYIYENWPDMAPYLSSGFPPSNTEWIDYNQYLQTDFSEWFDEYYDQIKTSHPEKCVKMIPVGRLISELLQMSPYNEIDITALYEDDAPHGRPSLYFLASMISYMAVYEEMAPASYQPNNFIDPIIIDNYESISGFFWNRLLEFNDANGDSNVFCKGPTALQESITIRNNYHIFPNPHVDEFYIKNLSQEVQLTIYNNTGQFIKSTKIKNATSAISTSDLATGIYFVKIYHKKSKQVQFLKFVKLEE